MYYRIIIIYHNIIIPYDMVSSSVSTTVSCHSDHFLCQPPQDFTLRSSHGGAIVLIEPLARVVAQAQVTSP